MGFGSMTQQNMPAEGDLQSLQARATEGDAAKSMDPGAGHFGMPQP